MSFESIDWDDDELPVRPVRPVWTRWSWWRRLLGRVFDRAASG
jgi:hypothetical protein